MQNYIKMETYDSKSTQNSQKDLDRKVKMLSIISLVLLATTLLFAILYFTKTTQVRKLVVTEQQTSNEKQQLSDELTALMAEHEALKAENAELAEKLSVQDSVIMANAAEIEKLIAQQADYKLIKKKIARLQNISQEYVKQMDQLIAENKVLKEENTQLTETVKRTQDEKAAVEQDNANLTQRINAEAKLKAYNIRSSCSYAKKNGTEMATDKANRARKIKTTFTLAENSLIEPGSYNVYCRISVPGDGRVLTPGKSDAYTFMNNGQRLQYSAKGTVNYVNKAENVTLVWDIRDNDKAIKGTYIVQVFTDNALLGETRFTLQ